MKNIKSIILTILTAFLSLPIFAQEVVATIDYSKIKEYPYGEQGFNTDIKDGFLVLTDGREWPQCTLIADVPVESYTDYTVTVCMKGDRKGAASLVVGNWIDSDWTNSADPISFTTDWEPCSTVIETGMCTEPVMFRMQPNNYADVMEIAWVVVSKGNCPPSITPYMPIDLDAVQEVAYVNFGQLGSYNLEGDSAELVDGVLINHGSDHFNVFEGMTLVPYVDYSVIAKVKASTDVGVVVSLGDWTAQSDGYFLAYEEWREVIVRLGEAPSDEDGIIPAKNFVKFAPEDGFGGTLEVEWVKLVFSYDIQAGEEFEENGIVYSVINPGSLTCQVKGINKVSGDVIIPDAPVYNSLHFTVIEIGNNAFAGSSYLNSISLPSTIETIYKNAFSGCDRLTSFVWRGNKKLQSDVVESIGNPNLLVYVDSAKFAPDGLDHNVVANGICENLVLIPGYPFTPVYDFTAKTSSMKKDFLQTTPVDGCAGWETIVLPFDVRKVTSPEGHVLIPFAAVSDVNRQRPFWLYEADPAGEWQESSGIKAGVPYIISMPNNPRYNPAYNIHGTVTFSNPNPQKITTETTMPYVATWASGREFRSLWLPLEDSEISTAMGLNVGLDNLTDDDGSLLAPGSAFHTGVLPKPLEAYVVRNDNANAFRIQGLQSAVLTLPAEDGLKIAQDGTTVMLNSSTDRIVDIYSADGTLLRKVELKAGDHVYVDGLPQGVCLIAGRKVMIKY